MSEHEFRTEIASIMKQQTAILEWQQKHEEKDAERFGEVHGAWTALNKRLDPIVEAFTTTTTMGKWGKKGLVVLLTIISIIWGVIQIIKNLK